MHEGIVERVLGRPGVAVAVVNDGCSGLGMIAQQLGEAIWLTCTSSVLLHYLLVFLEVCLFGGYFLLFCSILAIFFPPILFGFISLPIYFPLSTACFQFHSFILIDLLTYVPIY